MNDTEFIEKWLEYLIMNKGRSVRTTEKYGKYLNRLIKYCHDNNMKLLDVTPDDLDVFTGVYAFKTMNLGARSRRALVAAVRGFYSWCSSKNIINQDPSRNVSYPKAPHRLPKAFPLDAAEKLMWAPDMTTFIGVRDSLILSLMIGCGLRVSGVVRLNESDLKWSMDNGRELLSIKTIEKGDKERLVPAPDETRLMVRAYLGHEYLDSINRNIKSLDRVLLVSTKNHRVMPGDLYGEKLRLGAQSINNMIIKYGEQSGIPSEYLHPHALRHLYGVELTEDGVDVVDRMALMGHSDVKSAEIYSHISQRKLRRIIDKSNPLMKMKTPVSSLSKILQQDKQ